MGRQSPDTREGSDYKVIHVRSVIQFGLLVGLGDRDKLSETQPVRVERLASFGHHVPVTVRHVFSSPVSKVREKSVLVIVIGTEIPRFR